MAAIQGKNPSGAAVDVLVDALGRLYANVVTVLNANDDSIDVACMSKGPVTTVHSAITSTVALASCTEVNCQGFNALLVYFNETVGSGPWTLDVYGTTSSGGTYVPCYKVDSTNAMELASLAANGCYAFRGIPDFIKVIPTLVSGSGTVTVKVQPVNL